MRNDNGILIYDVRNPRDMKEYQKRVMPYTYYTMNYFIEPMAKYGLVLVFLGWLFYGRT